MKKIGGCKKARYWNMARFQTRRWHREHAEVATENNIEPKAATLAPATDKRTSPAMLIPSPGGEGQGEGRLSSNTRLISPIQPLADTPPSSSSSVSSVVNSNSFCKTGIHNELANSERPILHSALPTPHSLGASPSSSHPPLIQPSTNPEIQPQAPPASRSSRPSVNEDLKNSFITLRANGWSFRSISQKLGVPKSTLFNWESNRETHRAIDVIKCIHIERLQERYLPSFEEELQKLSGCLARIERALEKQDFDKMKPEFLLRTFLQLRSRLNGLRRDVHPTDTLDHGPNPKMMTGCISRAAQITDSDANPIPSPGGEGWCPSGRTEGGLLKALAQNPMSTENPKWDNNQNSKLSHTSPSATSINETGTPVPLSHSSMFENGSKAAEAGTTDGNGVGGSTCASSVTTMDALKLGTQTTKDNEQPRTNHEQTPKFNL